WLISVSGMMGSGKTTLARGLASALGWAYVPEYMPATKYLPDLFQDSRRWAFETQSAFLTHKAIQVFEACENNQNIIVDRSLYEDSEIFAYHFFQKGDIDERAFETYQALANHFIRELPSPDLILFCKCRPQTIEARIQARGRDFQL